jgi:hypothetical protein
LILTKTHEFVPQNRGFPIFISSYLFSLLLQNGIFHTQKTRHCKIKQKGRDIMSAFIQSLDKLLEATAWEMNPPPAYGVFHLSFTFIGVFICILFARKLRNLSERGHKIVLGSVGGFLAR